MAGGGGRALLKAPKSFGHSIGMDTAPPNTWQQTSISRQAIEKYRNAVYFNFIWRCRHVSAAKAKTWNHFGFWSLSLGLLFCLIKESTVLLTSNQRFSPKS